MWDTRLRDCAQGFVAIFELSSVSCFRPPCMLYFEYQRKWLEPACELVFILSIFHLTRLVFNDKHSFSTSQGRFAMAKYDSVNIFYYECKLVLKEKLFVSFIVVHILCLYECMCFLIAGILS